MTADGNRWLAPAIIAGALSVGVSVGYYVGFDQHAGQLAVIEERLGEQRDRIRTNQERVRRLELALQRIHPDVDPAP